MGAFDGTNKIARAVTDPLTDHTLPSSKSLSWEAVTTPAALAGTTGTHCDLVHGDHWTELKGNHTENIAQNQTIKVVGKHKETLVESCYQNIIGPHIVQNNNVRNETRLGTFTKTYGDFDTQEDYDGHLTKKDINLEHINAFDFEYCTSKVEITPAHVEVKVIHLTVEAVELGAFWVNMQTAIFDLEWFNTSLQGSVNAIKVKPATDVSLNGLQKIWLGVAHLFGGPTSGVNCNL